MLPAFLGLWPPLHPQSQQHCIFSSLRPSCCFSLTALPPLYRDACDHTGPTRVIQCTLPFFAWVLACVASEEKSDVKFSSPQVFPSTLASFKIFFILDLMKFEYDMPRLFLLFLLLFILSVLETPWIYGLVFDINLGEILSHYCFKYSFCSFLLVFPLCICYMFCSCPRVFGYLIPLFLLFFFWSFFSLRFLVLEVSIDVSLSSEFLSSAMSSQPNN